MEGFKYEVGGDLSSSRIEVALSGAWPRARQLVPIDTGWANHVKTPMFLPSFSGLRDACCLGGSSARVDAAPGMCIQPSP